MTPRQFLTRYQYDQRLVTGAFYPAEALPVKRGDRVAVVMLNLGGPNKVEEVRPFLYNLFMDPAIIDIPVRGWLRHWLCGAIARLRSKAVGKDYEVIGGGSPINRLTREQAGSLEKFLNKRFGEASGVRFRTYVAMRYWHPFSEETARQMAQDGVDKVVLLPLYPQYSKTTTGASLLYWHTLEQAEEIPVWPTTSVFEYAAHPKYVQALSERIDEGLQRFPKHVRDDVQILFSAHGTPLKEMKERRDPYCCLVHSTVDRVMAQRGNDRSFHVAFQSKVGPAEWLTPSTPAKLEELAHAGNHAVLVVPIAFVTEHIETLYELDIEVRQEAEEAGIQHFEVMPALNSHPLFIEALAEAAVSQLQFPEPVENGLMAGDGSYDQPLRPLADLPHPHPSERCVRCHQCEFVSEARRWGVTLKSTEPRPIRTQPRQNA